MDAITGQGRAGREHTTSEANRVISAIEQCTKAIAPLADDDPRTAADLREQATTVAAFTRAAATNRAKEERTQAAAKRKAQNAAEKESKKKNTKLPPLQRSSQRQGCLLVLPDQEEQGRTRW